MQIALRDEYSFDGMMKHRVTIGIANYSKTQRFYDECLESIKDQTFTDYIIKTDDREGVYSFPKWNKFIEEAETEYVTCPHADDIYLPTYLEECVEYLDNHPNVAAVFTLDSNIDEQSNRIAGSTYIPIALKDEYSFEDIFDGMMKHGNFLRCETVVFRKSMMTEDLRYTTEEAGGAGDCLLWFKILNKHPIGIINKVLVRSRVHTDQDSHQQRLGDKPVDHFYAIDAASKLRPSVRKWDVHSILTKCVDNNEAIKRNNTLINREEEAKNSRFIILHEPPQMWGTGILCRERVLNFNNDDSDFITYYVFPDNSETSTSIRKTIYRGVPTIVLPNYLLKDLVGQYNPAEIEIHHTLRWNINNMLFLFEDPYVDRLKVYLHDSVLWCAQYHQCNSKGHYCDGPTPEKCHECTNLEPERIVKMFKNVREVFSRAKDIYANSEWLANQASQFFGRQDIKIYKWDVPPIKPKKFKHKVGYFGAANVVKGFGVLLEASRLLPDVLFILFSDISEGISDTKLIAGLDNVVALGRYTREEMPLLANLVDLCVVPSIVESYGLVARELTMCDVPVIVTKTGGLADIGTIEPDNVEALVEAIKEKLND